MASTITTDIIFDHRGKKGRDEVGPIEIRVTYERKSKYIGTGVSVARHDFVGGSIVGRADKDELNRRVNIILRKVQEEVNRYIDENRPLDVAEIKRRAWSVRDDLIQSLRDQLAAKDQLIAEQKARLIDYRRIIDSHNGISDYPFPIGAAEQNRKSKRI